jgi:hypothetical protein
MPSCRRSCVHACVSTCASMVSPSHLPPLPTSNIQHVFVFAAFLQALKHANPGIRWYFYSHLLPTINQPLLHGRDALALLDALLDPRDGVVGFDVELDFLACERADSVEHMLSVWRLGFRGLVMGEGRT